MAKQTTLNKEFTIKNGNVIIVETTEKQLNKAELQSEKIQLLNRQAQLTNQIAELQIQYSNIGIAVSEIDGMIEGLERS